MIQTDLILCPLGFFQRKISIHEFKENIHTKSIDEIELFIENTKLSKDEIQEILSDHLESDIVIEILEKHDLLDYDILKYSLLCGCQKALNIFVKNKYVFTEEMYDICVEENMVETARIILEIGLSRCETCFRKV